MKYTLVFYVDGNVYAHKTSDNEEEIWDFFYKLKNEQTEKHAKDTYIYGCSSNGLHVYYSERDKRSYSFCYDEFVNTEMHDFNGNDIFTDEHLMRKRAFDIAKVSDDPMKMIADYLIKIHSSVFYKGLYLRPCNARAASISNQYCHIPHLSGDLENVSQDILTDYVRIDYKLFMKYRDSGTPENFDFDSLILKSKPNNYC